MKFGFWEIFLLIVIVLIIFAGARMVGVGKKGGRGGKDFKDEQANTVKDENKKEDAK